MGGSSRLGYKSDGRIVVKAEGLESQESVEKRLHLFGISRRDPCGRSLRRVSRRFLRRSNRTQGVPDQLAERTKERAREKIEQFNPTESSSMKRADRTDFEFWAASETYQGGAKATRVSSLYCSY